MSHGRRSIARVHVLLLAVLLSVALGLRIVRLPELPVGLHYDEAANGILAAEIARGDSAPLFIEAYTGKEVLFFYWTALLMRLLGRAPLSLRLSAALIGSATVMATVFAVHELFHGTRHVNSIALASGALLTTSFWHLVLSRYGFRAITQPLMQALTVGCLWRGLRLGKRSDGALGRLAWPLLGGLCIGLTAYTYLAARAFPLPVAASLLAILMAGQRHQRRVYLQQIALFLTAALLALAPLGLYWWTHPGSFSNRMTQVAATSWRAAWRGIVDCLGMFVLRGDPYIRFNLPGRPAFPPLLAAFFLLGIIWACAQLVRPVGPALAKAPGQRARWIGARVFLLTALPVMILPSALASGEITPSNLRLVGELPFIYAFPALALTGLVTWILERLKGHHRWPVEVLAPASLSLMLLVGTLPGTIMAYFRAWAPSDALYEAADGDLLDVSRYLNNGVPDGIDLRYVASEHYRHPTLAFLTRDCDTIRTLTGGRTVVLPAEGDALLIYPRSMGESREWVASALHSTSAEPITPPMNRQGSPAFHAYRVSSSTPLTPHHAARGNFGHAAALSGYDVITPGTAGGSIELAVLWEVLNPPQPGDYGPVVRIEDAWGFTWGSAQPFHYPSEQWTKGERVLDLIEASIEPGAPPGTYAARVGFFSAQAGQMVPLLDEEERFAGNWVDLPILIRRPARPAMPEELNIRHRLDISTTEGDVLLLGSNLDTRQAKQGEPIFVTLFWQATLPPQTAYELELRLGETSLSRAAPVHGTYPTTEWMVGEIVADRHGPRIPLDQPAGTYRLSAHLIDQRGKKVLKTNLGPVEVEATERRYGVPPITEPITATFGGQVDLLGYDLSTPSVAPGETLTLTLYWRARRRMDQDYTVFAHLVAADGHMGGQQDNAPVFGSYPTTLWAKDEVIVDVYAIDVGPEAHPGPHTLEVGLYIADTGARLPLAADAGDAVVLQTVQVSEVR